MATLTVSRTTHSCRLRSFSLPSFSYSRQSRKLSHRMTTDTLHSMHPRASYYPLITTTHYLFIVQPRISSSTPHHSSCLIGLRPPMQATRHLVLYLCCFVGDPQSPLGFVAQHCYRLSPFAMLLLISVQCSCCPLRSSFVVLFIHLLVDNGAY